MGKGAPNRDARRAEVEVEVEVSPADRRRQWLADYRAGRHPYAQIHPADRPSRDVQRDPFGDASQAWLAENAPLLTLESCARQPAPIREGYTLRIPGDGAQVLAEDEVTQRTRKYRWTYGIDGRGRSHAPAWTDEDEDVGGVWE
jgi:hypothetical protein